MTIGPEPMIRIFEMSLRRGISPLSESLDERERIKRFINHWLEELRNAVCTFRALYGLVALGVEEARCVSQERTLFRKRAPILVSPTPGRSHFVVEGLQPARGAETAGLKRRRVFTVLHHSNVMTPEVIGRDG